MWYKIFPLCCSKRPTFSISVEVYVIKVRDYLDLGLAYRLVGLDKR